MFVLIILQYNKALFYPKTLFVVNFKDIFFAGDSYVEFGATGVGLGGQF